MKIFNFLLYFVLKYDIIVSVIYMAVFTDEKIELFDRQKRDASYIMDQAHYHSKNELYFSKK